MNEIRENIKNFLRNRLIGKDNIDTKKRFMEELEFTNENIKSYTNLNLVVIPPVESFPKICEFFNVSLYEFFGIKDPSNLSEIDKERLRKIKANPSLADIIDKNF